MIRVRYNGTGPCSPQIYQYISKQTEQDDKHDKSENERVLKRRPIDRWAEWNSFVSQAACRK